MKDYGFKKDKDGYPLSSDCATKAPFEKYFTSPEVAQTWEDFYNNYNNGQDHLVAHWERVVTKFHNHPAVIGYDLLNEPWAANWLKDIRWLAPGKFEREKLQPIWQKVSAAIRKIDTEKIIFFEGTPMPGTYPFFGGIVNQIGFTETPSNSKYSDREILNDHHYCCLMSGSECDSGEPPLKDAPKCANLAGRKLVQWAKDAKRLNTGLFITEFGACSNSDNCGLEITGIADACDQTGTSWAYWQYKGFGDFTTTGDANEGLFLKSEDKKQEKKIKALVRTYAQKYQGKVIKSVFNGNNSHYLSFFDLDLSVKEFTRVYFNTDYFYKNNKDLKIS